MNAFSAFNYRIRVLLLLQLLVGIFTAPCLTFLPIYLNELGRSAVFISLVFAAQRVTSLLSSLGGGTLSDFLSRKQTLLIGQIVLVGATLVFVSPTSAVIILLWSLHGIGSGLSAMGGQSYLIDNADHAFLGMLTAFYYWGHTLGSVAGNPLAGVLLTRIGYRSFGVSLASLGLVTVALTILFLPHSVTDLDHAHEHHTRDDVDKTRPGLLGYGEIAARPAVLLLACMRFLPTFCYGMMTIFMPLLIKRAHGSTATIAFYATVSNLCAALSQLTVGRIADKVGPKWPAVIAYGVLCSSALLVGVFPGSLRLVVIFGVVGISAAWSLSVLLSPLVARASEAPERGRVLGYIHLFWNLGMILSSLVGGFLFEVWAGLPLIVGASFVLVCPVLVFTFFRRINGQEHHVA